MKVSTMVKVMQGRESETNDRGNTIHRAFMPSERYAIDFAPDFNSEGWQQFDTDQDAHYFGVWVNWEKMQTLTYAEGDWTLVVCPDREHYLAEIRGCIQFYGEGQIAATIDTKGTLIRYVQDRQKFLEPPHEQDSPVAG